MNVKKIIPGPLKSIYHKFRWFASHYQEINYGTKLHRNQLEHFLGPVTYNTDSLCTSNNADFINEPRFAKAYAAAASTNPWDGFTLQWRVYIVCWLADHVKGLPGEFVECGVNTGAYSRAVIDYVDFNSLGKTFFLFDTYQGLVEDQVSEEEKAAGISRYLDGHYPDVYQQVVNTFKPFNTKIVKGAVPDTLPEFDRKNVCFLSIDMNCVAPEIAAIEFFWDKLVPGAVIILDDYGFPPHIEQKKAFDQFAAGYGVNILTLPTGQGIMFKP